MIDALTFLNHSLFLPILIGTGILACVCIWKEWQHFATIRFWIKIIVAIIGLLALALLALKPAIKMNKNAEKVIVLTPNYKKVRLDSLRTIHKNNSKSINYKPNTSLFETTATIDSVFVLGEGLESYDLWQLETKKVAYLGDTLPSGIIKYRYKHKLTEGEQLLFSGIYNLPKKGNQLVLRGPGGVALDSLKLDSLKQQSFQLKTALKARGNYLYTLIEKDVEGNIVSQNPIPVEVKKREHLKILIINGFPTFESKYLKNFLAENGHEVLVRSQVTKKRFKYEYFNTEKTSIGSFKKANLKAYDLLIIDANSLSALGKSSKNALENTISEEGLGVLIQANTSFFNRSKNLVRFDFQNDGKTKTTLENSPKIKIQKRPFQFKTQFNLEPLLKAESKAVLAAYKRKGAGRVGTTVLSNTYELVLNGQTNHYGLLWSKTIEGLSKRNEKEIEWAAATNLAKKDYPFAFKLRLKGDTIPEVKTKKGYRIAMQNTIDFPKLWQGKTFPIASGWQTLNLTQDSTSVFNYFVQDTLAWKANTAYTKMLQNKRFSNKANPTKTAINTIEPINPLWFFIAFVVCMGILWLLPKVLE